MVSEAAGRKFRMNNPRAKKVKKRTKIASMEAKEATSWRIHSRQSNPQVENSKSSNNPQN